MQTDRLKNENKMENEVLASLYPIVKHLPEAPLNVRIIAHGMSKSEEELLPLFKKWLSEGIVDRKYESVNVYKLTTKGLDKVSAAFKEKEKK